MPDSPDGGGGGGAGGALDEALLAQLTKRGEQGRLRRLTTVPPGSVDFSSNAYLSLPVDDLVLERLASERERERQRERKGGTSSGGGGRSLFGSGGSRLLDGNSAAAEGLERRIAAFHGSPAALLFNSAFDANVGLLSCVPRRGDVIVHDELVHASIHDGMRQSRASRRLPFSHASIAGAAPPWVVVEETGAEGGGSGNRSSNNKGAPSLSDVLRGLAEEEEEEEEKKGEGEGEGRNVFVCVEALYSMDGDVADLGRVRDAVRRWLPPGRGHIIVDETHSVGVLGERGRGLVCEMGMEDEVWARVVGLGKAISCTGGAVLCSPITRSYLVNYARTLIYTTFMAASTLASIDVVYAHLASGRAEPARAQLRRLAARCRERAGDLERRLRPPPSLLRSLVGSGGGVGVSGNNNNNAANHKQQHDDQWFSPIFPLLTSQPRSLAAHCQRRGFVLRPIAAPTVPPGLERVRVCLHGANSLAQVDRLFDAVEAWVEGRMRAPGGAAAADDPQDDAAPGTLLVPGPAARRAKL